MRNRCGQFRRGVVTTLSETKPPIALNDIEEKLQEAYEQTKPEGDGQKKIYRLNKSKDAPGRCGEEKSQPNRLKENRKMRTEGATMHSEAKEHGKRLQTAGALFTNLFDEV